MGRYAVGLMGDARELSVQLGEFLLGLLDINARLVRRYALGVSAPDPLTILLVVVRGGKGFCLRAILRFFCHWFVIHARGLLAQLLGLGQYKPEGFTR